jgi:hypothetical protein
MPALDSWVDWRAWRSLASSERGPAGWLCWTRSFRAHLSRAPRSLGGMAVAHRATRTSSWESLPSTAGLRNGRGGLAQGPGHRHRRPSGRSFRKTRFVHELLARARSWYRALTNHLVRARTARSRALLVSRPYQSPSSCTNCSLARARDIAPLRTPWFVHELGERDSGTCPGARSSARACARSLVRIPAGAQPLLIPPSPSMRGAVLSRRSAPAASPPRRPLLPPQGSAPASCCRSRSCRLVG